MARPLRVKKPEKEKHPKIEKVKDKNGRVIKYSVKENGKKDTWRPSKLSPEVVNKLVEEFRYDATVEEACSYAWISTQLFYKWLNDYPEFFDEIDRAIKRPFRMARRKLIDLAGSAEKEELQFKATQEFLSKRDSRYKAKTENTDVTLSTPESQEDLIRNKSMIDLEEMRKKLLG